MHSDVLCLITPHILGGGDDETDFASSLIESAFDRPKNFSNPTIEIHAQGPDDPHASDYAQRLNSLKNNICASIRTALRPNQAVTLI